MLARAFTFAIDGLEARPVTVEVDIRPGLPAFTIVGLADKAVRESRERVRAALLNSGFQFPMSRIVVNLAPAFLRKAGPGFDLPIAVAVLAASEQLPPAALPECAVYGELALGGELRSVRGALAVAESARRIGTRTLVLPRERAGEAALVDGLAVAGVTTLREATDVLAGGEIPPLPPSRPREPPAHQVDLEDVRGHALALEAVEVAAAGGHNVLLSGPPGSGKTMLARRLPSILPPLTRDEAIEVTRIHSVAGRHAGTGLATERPFRAPHHTISPAGLVGGGRPPAPGEATLAHLGVLFLDELSEFAANALEALRQPVEDGRVAIVRGQWTVTFPTRVMLVAATNPCPCGRGDPRSGCMCSPAQLERHRRRLSAALLDRLDVLVEMDPPSARELAAPPLQSSTAVRERVAAARERQRARLQGTEARCNADMTARVVRDRVRLTAAAARVLARAYDGGHLSARGRDRALRVAQTVADLAGADRVADGHVLRALALRLDHQQPTAVAA